MSEESAPLRRSTRNTNKRINYLSLSNGYQRQPRVNSSRQRINEIVSDSPPTQRSRLNDDIFDDSGVIFDIPSSAQSSQNVQTISSNSEQQIEDMAKMLGLTIEEYEAALNAERIFAERMDQIRNDEIYARNQNFREERSETPQIIEEFPQIDVSNLDPCVICLEEVPKFPTFCVFCKKVVGCFKCANSWFKHAGRHNQIQSCPLCRCIWYRSSFKKIVVSNTPRN